MTSGLRPTSLVLVTLTVLSACGDTQKAAPKAPATPADSAPASTTAAASSPRAPVPRARKWIDLSVGDCLADPPPTDPGVITVKVVDCAAAHAAEVFSRVPVAVDAAIASVANRECATGFSGYTGESEGTGALTVTYLIDSDQDRTSANPDPSTVICLLQNVNGQPLTGSARR